jgi:general secretion pathway protein B
MSLILDALKKLEQEKAARRDLELGPAILKGRPRRPSPRRWLIPGVVVGAILVVTAAGLHLKGRPDRAERTVTQPAAAPVTAPPAPPLPAAPTSVPAVPRPPATTAAQAENASPRPALPTGVQGTMPPPPPAPAVVEPVRNPAPPVDLKVSGIAWQEERRGRRAVVNGLLLAEGESIAGARLVEIRPDRVRFSTDGRSFDIQFSTPFPTK